MVPALPNAENTVAVPQYPNLLASAKAGGAISHHLYHLGRRQR
jgi:hypothetical protein